MIPTLQEFEKEQKDFYKKHYKVKIEELIYKIIPKLPNAEIKFQKGQYPDCVIEIVREEFRSKGWYTYYYLGGFFRKYDRILVITNKRVEKDWL